MSGIDFSLPNFPLLNQNHEPSNPYPNVNADMDCVPTSIAAALWWFTGTEYYGDQVIDQVYGSGYTGGTAASAYTAYCAARGVTLSPVSGTPAELVTAIHTYLHEQCPVLVTVPGQWNNPATSGTNPGAVTHVMVVCGDGAGLIQVMNPWTGAFEVYSDSWFQVKLCYGQVWPMERVMDSNYQQTAADNLVANGHNVHGWICSNILASVNSDKLSVVLGLPQEENHEDSDGRWRQRFTYAIASQHSQNQSDFRFEALPVPDTSALQAQLTQAQSDLNGEQQQVVTLKAQAMQLQQQLAAQMNLPVSGNAADSAALDELAKLLPSLTKALASRAPGQVSLAPMGAQTKPLPAVQ